MTYDLWSEASHDYDAERRARNLEMAKAASQGTWAFLALAQSPEEFGDRMALASDQIMTTAAQCGVDMRELTDIFTQRFALLMEAKDNPFADQDDEGDSDSGDDDSSDDSDDSSDSSDDDDSDDENSDDDSDSSDSDDDGDSGDDDSGSDDSDDDKGPAQQGFQPYASLAARIRAGEDPLAWGNAPFARSSARKEAADGAPPVSDVNTPQPDPGGTDGSDMPPGGSPSVPGMDGGIAETTKPRQLPGGSEAAPGMGMDAIADPMMDGQFNPEMNGGDIQQGADEMPPDPGRMAKIKSIASEVRRYNPTLSAVQCRKVAARVYDQYLVKHAEDMSPLLFGDRGDVADGPATHKVKTWSPPDMKPAGQQGGAEQDEDGSEGSGPKRPSPGDIVSDLLPVLAL